VEAIKLGAIDYLQKPFVPDEIRTLVTRMLDRRKLIETKAKDYATSFELAKRCLSERHFDSAVEHLKRATGIDPKRPEAFNLLGVIHEVRGEHSEAMNNYRVAYHTDATYKPARDNLERAGSTHQYRKPISLGDLRDTR
jgi:Tfp pilus assembly protein PilF